MDIDDTLEHQWQALLNKFKERFEEEPDEQVILYMIGLQELGKNYRRFSKDEKLDIIHIGICTLLSEYGYYDYLGRDKDGWPHWERSKKLPNLSPVKQSRLIKEAIIHYFE